MSFQGFFFLSFLNFIFFYFFYYPTGTLLIYYGVQFYVFMELLSLHTSVSLNLYQVLVPFLGPFSFCFLALSYSNLFLLVLHYYILSYYYPLGACLFLRKYRKRVDPDGTGGGEKVGGVGRENHNQDTLYEKTSSFKFLKNR